MEINILMLGVDLDFTSLTFTAVAFKVMHAEIRSGEPSPVCRESTMASGIPILANFRAYP